MANDFALGKALEIPESVLKNIDAIDKKIENISKNAENMSKSFNSAFSSINGNANRFLEQLNKIQASISNLGNLNNSGISSLNKGLGNTATQAEKVVNSVTRVATTMNKLASSSNSGFSPNNSVLAWQGLQKNIEQVQQRQEQLLKITREYENELSRINSGKGGVISKSQTESYQSALKEIEANKQLIASYREKQQAIIAYQAQQRQELQNLQALKNLESQRTSLPEQRSANELKKLNDYYRELEKSSAKAAEAQEKAAQRQQQAQERAAAAAQKAAQQQDTRTNNKALDAYNRAMAASEALVTQRINKIAKLRQAEEMLTATGRNYTEQLKRIQSEISRLNKLNEGQIKANGQIVRSQHNLMNISGQLARKFALVFSVSQISSYLIKLRDVTGEFELQNTALASILKNQNQADVLFQQITDLAVRSPFTVKQLTTYTKSLSAYGFEYEKLYDTTKRLADVAAGLGVDMQRIILAYGQVSAANFLRGTETRQFSEAGLNILKELAEYYSEVEGRAVSLGEVQDRQFKKMISFQDVEEVFKRITSEGGTFYEMQERQAETIAGQVSNLQDSIDIMLNSIGQSNRKVITTMISAVKSLVENWQIFADMLNGVGVFMAVYTVRTLAAAAANGKFSASALAATASMGGLRGALATVMQGFQSIFNFAKANPFLLIASAVVFLGSRLYTHAQNVKEAKKQYDLLTKSLNDNKDEFNKMITTIQNQNKAIENANKAVKNAGNNTAEYAEAQEKLRHETEEQTTNIEKLKSKFPQIAASIKQNADGTYDLAEATKAYNEAMEGVERINYFAKNTETFWNDGIKENLIDATEAQGEYNQAERDGINILKDLKIASDDFFNSAIGKHYPDVQKEINNILNSTDSAYDKFTKIRDLLNNKPIVRGAIWNNDVSDAFHKLDTSLSDTKDNYDDLSDNIKDISKKIRKEYDLNTEEGKKKAKEYTEEFIRQLNIQNEEVRKFVEQEFTIHIGVQIDTQNIAGGAMLGAIPLFSNVERRINDYLNKKGFNLLGEIKAGTGREQYSADIKKKYEDAVKELEELKVATEERYDNISNENRKKYLETYISQAKQYLKDWEGYVEKTKKKRESKKNPELDRLKEMISLIQKAQDEYEKLRDYESEEISVSKVKKTYKGSIAGGIISGMPSFDTQSVKNALEQLRSLATKAGKDGRKALEEALRPLEIQLLIDVKEDQLDKIKKKIDETFEDYDLSKDLLGTGFDANFIKTIFNVPITSLDELKKKLQELKPQLVGQGKEYEKTWDEAIKKVKELQDKELLERTKKYAEYLKYQYSETTKIMLQLRKDMAEVATLDLTDVQKQSINQRLQEEANKKIQEQTWKDFKGSDMYTQMFDDLSKVSSKGLDYMVERLEELKGSLNDLDPSDLKQIIEQINKIKEEQIQRNPLEGLGGDIKEAWKFAKQRKELEEQITAEYKKQKTLIEQIPRQEQSTEESRKNYEKVVSVFGEDSDQAKEAKKTLDKQEKSLKGIKQELTDSEKKAKDLKEQFDKGAQAAKNLADKTAEFANKINQAVDSMQTLVNGLNSVFNMSDAFNDTMSSIMEFGTNMANTITSAGAAFAGFASGTPQGIFTGITQSVSAIGGLFSSIGSLFNIGDKKKEREIQRQIEKVNELQNAYEKLYDTIQNGLSLKVFSDNAQLIENLQKQISSYKKMIAAEEDKKDSDKNRIKEWKENISDLYDQIAELYDNMKEELVGNFKSLSEQLADSLVSAFENGEDAAESWGDTVKQAIVDIMQNLLVMKYIEPQVQQILDNLFSQAMPKTSAAEKISKQLAEAQEEYTKFINETNLNSIDDINDYLKRRKQLENEIKQLQELYDSLNEKTEGEIPDITEDMVDSTIDALTALQDSVINSPIVDIIKGLIDDINGNDELSGLQKGIQGITETQADALAAILESVRYYVADENAVIHNIYNTLIATDATSNPMLAELQSQTTLIRSIEGMMSSVIKVSGGKGRVLRVELV